MQLSSLDGVIGDAAEARIPVTDEGLLRGDGGFEVIRLYRGRPFALEDHWARLGRTSAGIRLDVDLDAFRAEVSALLAAAGDVDALLRLVVTRGGRRIALIEPLPPKPAAARVVTVTYSPTRVLDGLKTLSYAANMLAGRLAKEQGADEALLVSPHGVVLEGPTWTFFWVDENGTLCTPPLEDRILASITRARLMRGLDGIEERHCTRDDLRTAREAFIASSVREVLPIAAIDDLELPAAPGEVTQAASVALVSLIEAELAGSPATAAS